ncbi:hypothetical protein HDU76_008984 [Blyttiomyces sp. JEL0837]|nr:hypothetical protein HDU76_008984 [Blyttiomyces sp. JEL0837]
MQESTDVFASSPPPSRHRIEFKHQPPAYTSDTHHENKSSGRYSPVLPPESSPQYQDDQEYHHLQRYYDRHSPPPYQYSHHQHHESQSSYSASSYYQPTDKFTYIPVMPRSTSHESQPYQHHQRRPPPPAAAVIKPQPSKPVPPPLAYVDRHHAQRVQASMAFHPYHSSSSAKGSSGDTGSPSEYRSYYQRNGEFASQAQDGGYEPVCGVNVDVQNIGVNDIAPPAENHTHFDVASILLSLKKDG